MRALFVGVVDDDGVVLIERLGVLRPEPIQILDCCVWVFPCRRWRALVAEIREEKLRLVLAEAIADDVLAVFANTRRPNADDEILEEVWDELVQVGALQEIIFSPTRSKNAVQIANNDHDGFNLSFAARNCEAISCFHCCFRVLVVEGHQLTNFDICCRNSHTNKFSNLKRLIHEKIFFFLGVFFCIC